MTAPSHKPSEPPAPPFQRLDRSAPFPYSRSEYARRFLWHVVQRTLIRWSPPRAAAFRRRLGMALGIQMGEQSSFRPTAHIMHPWLLTIGARSILGDGVTVYNLGPVAIGAHTVISQDVYICAGTHDYTRPDLPLQRTPITIGSGVWICAGAFIGPGVTIGDNSVIGARAVVVSDIPPGVVAVGNPARVIKPRVMDGGAQ